jgi:Xaa-Pro dipeptidase
MTGAESVVGHSEVEGRQQEFAEKRGRIHKLLEEQGLDAIVISRHENIAWATAGLVDVRVPLLRETGVGSLLMTKQGGTYYLTTNNEAPRLAEEEFAGLGYEPLVQPWYANDVQASIRKIVGNGKVVADVPTGTTASTSLQPLRFELTASEVLRYHWLGQHTADTATILLRALRPGMRETTMQGMLAESLLSRGILPSVFLTAVDDRIRRYRHAVPRRGVLERFGMLNFCARRWGLSVSMTRFVHFGSMPIELEDKFLAVAQVNARLLGATREGVSSDELFMVAKKAYAAVGYAGEEKQHHQGGATGYLEREWVARPGGSERVAAQQAFAWNPNLPGAKVEDTFLLQDGSLETLTRTPDLPVISTRLQGVDYQSAGVLIG